MFGEEKIKQIVMVATEEFNEKISEKVFEDLTPKIKEVILQALREHEEEKKSSTRVNEKTLGQLLEDYEWKHLTYRLTGR